MYAALTTTNKLVTVFYGSGIANVTEPTLGNSSTRCVNVRGSGFHLEETAGPVAIHATVDADDIACVE